MLKYFIIFLFISLTFEHPVCSHSNNCGDGYCCKYNKGCFCSHYECYELCSHGDLIFGKSNIDKVQNGAVPSIRAEHAHDYVAAPTMVPIGEHNHDYDYTDNGHYDHNSFSYHYGHPYFNHLQDQDDWYTEDGEDEKDSKEAEGKEGKGEDAAKDASKDEKGNTKRRNKMRLASERKSPFELNNLVNGIMKGKQYPAKTLKFIFHSRKQRHPLNGLPQKEKVVRIKITGTHNPSVPNSNFQSFNRYKRIKNTKSNASQNLFKSMFNKTPVLSKNMVEQKKRESSKIFKQVFKMKKNK